MTTQNLTQLPTIQYTGMDYLTVIDQIKEIIESNSNWKGNWTEFYNTEAGTMLIQLFAWICENLSIRQDMLYNENFLSTATSDQAKRRLLSQIGYNPKSNKFSIVPIQIEFDKVLEKPVVISCEEQSQLILSEVKQNIKSFSGTDINGNQIPYEILELDDNLVPKYTKQIRVPAGKSLYTADEENNTIYACQGETYYKEFTSTTSDGPVFELTESNIDVSTIKVYNVTDNINTEHIKVDSFLDTQLSKNDDVCCYIVEQNDEGNYQIRYPSKSLVTFNDKTLETKMFPAGATIGVFFRTCAGSIGNIQSNSLSVTEDFKEGEETVSATITNAIGGYNGKDAETLDEAVSSAPLTIATLNRAVTITDFDRILSNNSLVLNCKSYSPENEPTDFKNFYGRKINPQEVFSFILLNKATNNIPNDKLNYFPWINLIKDSVLNEKYVFGSSKVNEGVGLSSTYTNAYLKVQGGQDTGDDGYTVGKKSARMYPNAMIFKTSNELQSSILQDEQDLKIKVKLGENDEDALFVDDILNIFGTKENLSIEAPVLKNNNHASYTTLLSEDIINCIKYKYIKFVIDDLFVVTVDLQQELKDLFTLYGTGTSLSESKTGDFVDYYTSYYLKLTNTPTETDEAYKQSLRETNITEVEFNRSMVSYHNSKTYANYRKGILELIKEQLKKLLEYGKEIDYENPTGVVATIKKNQGEQFTKNNLCYELYTNSINRISFPNNKYLCKYGNEYVAIQYDSANNIAKVFEISGYSNDAADEFNKTEIENVTNKTAEALAYDTSFANGSSSFIDLNLQVENPTTKKFLPTSYTEEVDGSIQFVGIDKVKKFYRLRINNRIFAIRFDAYSVISAYNHYLALSLNNNGAVSTGDGYNYTIYDYFPYAGNGDLITDLIYSDEVRIDDTVYNYKYVDLNNKNTNVVAELSRIFQGYFSRSKIDTNGSLLNPKNVIEYDTTSEVIQSDNISSVNFNLNYLCFILNYAFSPLNCDKGIVYEFKNNKWYDIKTSNTEILKNYFNVTDLTNVDLSSLRLIENGKLRARRVIKSNFPENKALQLSKTNISNEFESGYEYDLRIDFINNNNTDLTVESVEDAEIYDSENEPTKLEECETFDFITSIKGYKQSFSTTNVNYLAYDIATINNQELKIASPSVGKNSSLYLIQTSDSDLFPNLSLTNGYVYEYSKVAGKKYYNIKRSLKVKGLQKIELFIGDSTGNNSFTITEGVSVDDINEIAGTELEVDDTKIHTISVGDIICTDCDLNYINFKQLYLSYVLSTKEKMAIDKQENFYYSSDKTINEAAKPPIIGIEGESVYYDDEKANYFINDLKSNYRVKLTLKKVDTNNFDNIAEDTYNELTIVKNENVEFTSNVISGYLTDYNDGDPSDSSIFKPNGLAYNTDLDIYPVSDLVEASRVSFPLLFSVDELTNSCPAEGIEYSYNSYASPSMIVDVGSIYSVTGQYINNRVRLEAKRHANEYYSNNCYAFSRIGYNSTNKIIFSGIAKNNDGNITFYYPDSTAFVKIGNLPASDKITYLATKLFYKLLLGTNKTNPTLYNLYPKETMIELNSENIIATMDENSDEYFYCPMPGHHLKFIYRTFVDDALETSKYGDYFISAEPNGENGFADGYTFYINRTTHSHFPDKEFYLHFVNDRTYELNRNIDEDAINSYMEKYKIIGTELRFLKPYFKTFDVVGSISYNANYNVDTIKAAVTNAITSAYGVSALDKLKFSKSVYRSDIFKLVLGVSGVDSFELEYFGFDYTDQLTYPDKKYMLTTSKNASDTSNEFYLIPVLAESDGEHGLKLTFKKTDASTLS